MMEGQMIQLFRGMFAIDLSKPKQLKYWAARFGVTVEQLTEAASQAGTQTVNGLRLALAALGHIRLYDSAD
jgi:hypothetical protein